MEKRWLEVRFYYLCINILEKTQDVLQTVGFIENLAHLAKVKEISLKNLAYSFLTKPKYQPTKKEYVILAYLNKVPTRKIMKRCHMYPALFWPIIQEHKLNPQKFYSRLTPEEHVIMEKTLNAISFIKELL